VILKILKSGMILRGGGRRRFAAAVRRRCFAAVACPTGSKF
jgi:hypothetical protein